MFRDNSLMPTEAIRLTALALLRQGPRRYGELAGEVRHFTTHFWGPTLDVMASSIELMRLEGLIGTVEESETPGDALLRLSEAGEVELHELLSATVRVQANDFNKLVIALKLRFLDLLPPGERCDQVDTMIEMREGERARLCDLRAAHADAGSYFVRWLDHDIDRCGRDIAWLRDLRDEIDSG